MVMFSDDEPSDSLIAKIAQSICSMFKTKVHVGTIDYLSVDDFEYRESGVFSS